MKNHRHPHAFTLAELLVGMGILVLMFGFLIMATNQMVRAMGSTAGKIEQFRGARDAFERVTTRLSQATLNTYWDYKYDTTKTPILPTSYERRSELRFISGDVTSIAASQLPNAGFGQCVFFTAPLGYVETAANVGLENLLDVCGYYVEYSQDTTYRPKFVGTEVPAKWRWRLMEYTPSSERFTVYNVTSGGSQTALASESTSLNWIFPAGSVQTLVRPVTENVVALILIPRLSPGEEALLGGDKNLSKLAPKYKYNSTDSLSDASVNPKNQLPPVMQVTMVAIDEKTAEKLSLDSSSNDMFGVKNLFKDTAKFSADLEGPDPSALEKQLIAKRANYRVFSTNVHIRGAKWSRQQAKTP